MTNLVMFPLRRPAEVSEPEYTMDLGKLSLSQLEELRDALRNVEDALQATLDRWIQPGEPG